MKTGAVPVAVCAALANGLQGWDNAVIAGSLLYVVPEFHLQPTVQGTVVSASLIGAVLSTFVSGPAADWAGRKFLLLVAGAIFLVAAAVESWSPTVSFLIAGRVLNGLAVGFFNTVGPLFIAECAPPDIRGTLATLPQLMGISGMVLAYVMVFLVSLTPVPHWRYMFLFTLLPGVVFLALGLVVLPESPRWLVSRGRIKEARRVLEGLRGTEDVTGELALLVEGLGVSGDGTLEEWLLKPTEAGGEEE